MLIDFSDLLQVSMKELNEGCRRKVEGGSGEWHLRLTFFSPCTSHSKKKTRVDRELGMNTYSHSFIPFNYLYLNLVRNTSY